MPTQILTTLEYLGTFPDSATTTAHHFGIAVQVAASGAAVTAAMESLYKPWTWQNPGITIWPVKPDLSLDQPLKLIQIVPRVVTNAGTSTPTGPVDTAILAELNAQYSDAFTHSDFAWTDPQSPTGGATLLTDGRRAYPWPAHLAQLSRYPFPIPHLLNLSYIVKVDVSTPVVVSASQSYVAAVGFLTTPSSGVPVAYAPITTGATALAGRYTISYANQADTIALSTAVTMPATPPGDRFVTAYAEPSDWQANFVAGVADLFDFSARFIRPVRSACDHDAPTSTEGTFKAAIAADFGNYCNAIIYAQRDIVSYGANVGPNGSSLLSRLCDQWINEATSNQPARRLYAKGFTAAVVAAQSKDSDDAWLVLLKQNPELAGNALIDIPAKASVYDPTAAYAIGTVVVFNGIGYTALKALAAGTPVTPGSNAAVWSPVRRVTSVAPAHLNDKLLPLEHLQLRFTQNDLLSQLLLARWTAVAPPIQQINFSPSTEVRQTRWSPGISEASFFKETCHKAGL
jgi:hypothetical protein